MKIDAEKLREVYDAVPYPGDRIAAVGAYVLREVAGLISEVGYGPYPHDVEDDLLALADKLSPSDREACAETNEEG